MRILEAIENGQAVQVLGGAELGNTEVATRLNALLEQCEVVFLEDRREA
jgi:hypothetical protein